MNDPLHPENKRSGPRPWQVFVALAALFALLVVSVRSAGWPRSLLAERDFAGEEGEDKRTGSGRDFRDETLVVDTPSESLTALGFDSERAWSGYDDWEPAVAADPSSTYVYQLTTRYGTSQACRRCPDPAMAFRRSSTGGATWEGDRPVVPVGASQYDPQIEVAADGTIYAAWLQGYRPGILFSKSSDHGDTWTPPVILLKQGDGPRWADKPILALSPDGQHVYIAFNASDSFVSASHDFGQTFSAPVQTSNDTRYWFHNGGGVGPQGEVYFSAVYYSQDYTGDSNIQVLRSADGGLSWITTWVDSSAEMPDCPWSAGCYFGFFGPSAVFAIDPAGKIMIAYHAGNLPGAPQRMYVRTSTDGLTWSPRREVSNGSPLVNNAFPGLAAGPTRGDFRVVWQDDRNGTTDAWNTWYRRTLDGGITWSPARRLSNLGSGPPYKTRAGYRFPYGDYLEIAVDGNGISHVIWGEGISYDGPGGSWYTRGR